MKAKPRTDIWPWSMARVRRTRTTRTQTVKSGSVHIIENTRSAIAKVDFGAGSIKRLLLRLKVLTKL